MRSLTIPLLALAFATLSAEAVAKPTTFIEGNLRVQVLSPSVLRLELKGPKGFEDRKTFTVVGRDWPGGPLKVERGKDGVILRSKRFDVYVPANRHGLDGIEVRKPTAELLYRVSGLPVTKWFPSPGFATPSFAIADHPRLIPPPAGAVPGSARGPFAKTSGYDTSNDAPDMYLFVSDFYGELRQDYLHLTGATPMIPRFSLGFIDSRWYPYTEGQALAAIDEYRRRGIPLDTFVCDTDWRVGASKGYAVNTALFPDMPRFLRLAHDRGVRVMFNDHPEPQAPTALDPKETEYRYNGLSSLLKMGLDVWWFDRNWSTSLHEPMPGIRKETWGASVFRDVTQEVRPNQRPLLMSNVDGIDNGIRNGPPHPAMHRFPIWWTGDTQSNWNYLRYAVENAVDEGVIGLLPYVHEDLGGHVGEPTPELYTRFVQYGALSPITRVHCTFMLKRYPWAFGPEAETNVVDALKFRYRILPTLYSAVRRNFEDGTPIVRRLDLEYPTYPDAAANNQYLLGDDLLVAPIIQASNPPGSQTGMFHTPEGKAGLRGEYFANPNLAGSPQVIRTDAGIDFNWGYGAPADGVPANNFSVRWTGTIGPFPKSGDYRFIATSDDGARLFIDGKPVIQAWRDQAEAENDGVFRVEAGRTYSFRMEFYDGTNDALCRIAWLQPAEARDLTVERSAWIPPGGWINAWTGQRMQGPATTTVRAPLSMIPMWIREGGVVFTGADVVRTDEQAGKPITAELYVPEEGQSVRRRWYDDDGLSNDYLKGRKTERTISVHRASGRVEIRLSKSNGKFSGMPASQGWNVRIHLPAGSTAGDVRVNGRPFGAKVREAGAPAKSVLDVFEPRGGGMVEVPLGNLAPSASRVITLSLRA